MIKNEGLRVWVNRFIAFGIGGLAILIVISIAIIGPVRSQNAVLEKQLDEIQNGAAWLLNEANVFAEIASYDKAMRSLNVLFEKHPASLEAVEGAKLFAGIEAIVVAKDQRWEAAIDEIRDAWEEATATEMRAQFERNRISMETTMDETLAKEWEKSKAAIRLAWEKL